MRSFDLITEEGVSLYCRCWTAAQPRGCVVLVHGLSEHSGRYQELATTLNAVGFTVYAFDTRGHGLSAGSPDRLGILPPGSGWRHWVRDIATVIDRVGVAHPGRPVFLLGHSLGSLMAQHYAALHGERLAGLILSATDNRPGISACLAYLGSTLFVRMQGAAARSQVLDAIGLGNLKRSLPDRRTEQDWLSRDPAMVDAYLRDPWCGFQPSNGMWQAIAEGMMTVSNRLRGRAPAELPILFLVGTADLLSRGGRRVRRLQRAYRRRGVRHTTLISYPGARHEVFNEINRRQVYADLIAWLDGVLRRSTGSLPGREPPPTPDRALAE